MRSIHHTAVILALALCATSARAQERITQQLALARICASEAGLPRRVDDGWLIPADCAAIHAVLEAGAERTGLSYISYARSYSTRVFDANRSDARAWIAHLSPRGDMPQGWPQGTVITSSGEVRAPQWSHYRPAWLALYEHAGLVLAGEITHECEGEISDWGGAMDRERARRLGMVRVECGDTRNDFYLRRSLTRAST